MVRKQKDKATQSRVIYFDSWGLLGLTVYDGSKRNSEIHFVKLRKPQSEQPGCGSGEETQLNCVFWGWGQLWGWGGGGNTAKGPPGLCAGVRDAPGSHASPNAQPPAGVGSLPPPRAQAGGCHPQTHCPTPKSPQFCPGRC